VNAPLPMLVTELPIVALIIWVGLGSWDIPMSVSSIDPFGIEVIVVDL
jgi:hypothetical protein